MNVDFWKREEFWIALRKVDIDIKLLFRDCSKCLKWCRIASDMAKSNRRPLSRLFRSFNVGK
jgi:hypothetical protein